MFDNKNFVSAVIWVVVTLIAFIASMICMYTEDTGNVIIFQIMFWTGLLMSKIIEVQTQLNEIEKKIKD